MNLQIAMILGQDGVTNGAIYALLALSILLVFTVTRVLFIPQGEFVTFGALTMAAVQAGQATALVWLVVGLAVAEAAFDLYAQRKAGRPLHLNRVMLFKLAYPFVLAALPDFLKLGGKKVEGTILAASLMLVLDEMPDSNPSKKVAADYIAAYEKMHGSKPATFGANVYDAGLLLERAIPEAAQKGKPGTKEFRAALRDALEQTKELVATQGVYNMTPADHSGFDERGREMITVKDGTWKLLK